VVVISASNFTLQPLYYPAYSASFFDMHVCAFSIHTFSFCACLRTELRDNWLKGSTCTGGKQGFTTLLKGWKLVVLLVPSFTSVWLKKCLGTICIQNYFHLNYFCKFSYRYYTCLVN